MPDLLRRIPLPCGCQVWLYTDGHVTGQAQCPEGRHLTRQADAAFECYPKYSTPYEWADAVHAAHFAIPNQSEFLRDAFLPEEVRL